MPFQTMYEKLVAEKGLIAANAYMKEMRAKVKNPGLASIDAARRKEISNLGVAARKKKRDESHT